MVGDKYGSTMVGDKLDNNDKIICDDMRITTKKENDTAPILSVGYYNQKKQQNMEGTFVGYVICMDQLWLGTCMNQIWLGTN